MRPMSWESGSQLQTTAPLRGSSQSYIEARLASSASSERAMPSRLAGAARCELHELAGSRRWRRERSWSGTHRTRGPVRQPAREAWSGSCHKGDASRLSVRTSRRSGPGIRLRPCHEPDGGAIPACDPTAERRRTWRDSRATPSAERPPCRCGRQRFCNQDPASRASAPSSASVRGREPSERQWTCALVRTWRVERIHDEAHRRRQYWPRVDPFRRAVPSARAPEDFHATRPSRAALHLARW